ncbi:MAG: hypothetical protein JWN31_1041 [Frankiales bacterium]|nr:hypothetical protein [Frankiales bacterium]
MQTKAGLKLRSTACTTEVIVVRPTTDDVELSCCGEPMTTDEETGPTSAPEQHEVLLGKRYTDEATGIELLCTKPGPGPLAVDGRPVVVKGSKPLPSSD